MAPRQPQLHHPLRLNRSTPMLARLTLARAHCCLSSSSPGWPWSTFPPPCAQLSPDDEDDVVLLFVETSRLSVATRHGIAVRLIARSLVVKQVTDTETGVHVHALAHTFDSPTVTQLLADQANLFYSARPDPRARRPRLARQSQTNPQNEHDDGSDAAHGRATVWARFRRGQGLRGPPTVSVRIPNEHLQPGSGSATYHVGQGHAHCGERERPGRKLRHHHAARTAGPHLQRRQGASAPLWLRARQCQR